MLIGQYDGKIGEKHQVALPKKFREELGDKLIITKGFENCLIVVSEENWKTLLEGTEGRPFIDKDARELQRFLLGNATYVASIYFLSFCIFRSSIASCKSTLV